MAEILNNHLGMYETLIGNGINYQPQLVNAGFQPSTVVPEKLPNPGKDRLPSILFFRGLVVKLSGGGGFWRFFRGLSIYVATGDA